MTDDQLKQIFIRHKMDVLTLGENWKEVRPLVMDLMHAAPLTRLSNEELEGINRGELDPIQFRIKAREVLNVAQVKQDAALNQGKEDQA